MNLIFFDDHNRDQLLPLTFTRPVAELRIGILRISEKWSKILSSPYSHSTLEYLSEKYKLILEKENVCLLGGLLPDKELITAITELKLNHGLTFKNRIIALRTNLSDTEEFLKTRNPKKFKLIEVKQADIIDFPWQIFSLNGAQIEFDFEMLTRGRKSESLSKTNQLLGNQIFIEEGAKVECSVFNSERGPVYIGKDAEVMEGCIIRGPFALGEGSAVKMGAKIYGPTTIGPFSKAGGEINNSVIMAYSNKGHDGFLGNSVLGEWCNIGADTNNSNLKNNYAEVKLWSYPEGRFIKTGLQFCGLIMGDHSKCGINTMFNTGTVVGVSANIFGSGFPRNFIPSFSWGGAHGMTLFKLEKALEVAKVVMERRNIFLEQKDIDILTKVCKITEIYRKQY